MRRHAGWQPDPGGSTVSTTHTTVKLAGMAADLYGRPDHRAPLVLLPGLTFGRRIWQPALSELARIDPARQVLVLDLPGHGDSPDQPPYSTHRIVGLIHDAITEAALDAPVLVGHSMFGGVASLYATLHPARGVVNIDNPPDLGSFAQMLQSVAAKLRGSGFAEVWSMLEHSMRPDLLPAAAQQLVASTCHPTQELVVGYFEEALTTPPQELDTMVEDAMRRIGAARVPYLLIAGHELPSQVLDRIRRTTPQARVEVWANTGHFPHLAHPQRFAERLADTSRWKVEPDTRSQA
jgi:pimeloyl-ACP methyl ester carboxylesterase